MNETPPSKDAAPDEPGNLPLWKAALAWCDPVLVQALFDAHTAYFNLSDCTARANPFPMRGDQGLITQMVIGAAAGLDMGPQKAAGTDWIHCTGKVSKDLRERIATGEITLIGLQTKPRLKSTRTAVPSAWAGLLSFDWTKNTVTAKDAAFVDTVCARKQTAEAGAVDPAAVELKPSKARAAKNSRGRPSFPWEEMVTLAVERLQVRESNNQREVERLLTIFQQRFPGWKIPARRSMNDHIREIYVIAGQRAGTLNP